MILVEVSREVIERLKTELAEARAQIAASEQEHQDFRLQNDAEWRAKLDHLKAQIAAKDARIAALEEDLKYMGGVALTHQAQIAELTKKANFNEGLRDVAMRDNAIKDRQIAALRMQIATLGETPCTTMAPHEPIA